jgi:hypothetical protein
LSKVPHPLPHPSPFVLQFLKYVGVLVKKNVEKNTFTSKPLSSRVVDPDRVGSASFCRIRIGIQGMTIRIDIESKQIKKLINLTFFQKNFNNV